VSVLSADMSPPTKRGGDDDDDDVDDDVGVVVTVVHGNATTTSKRPRVVTDGVAATTTDDGTDLSLSEGDDLSVEAFETRSPGETTTTTTTTTTMMMVGTTSTGAEMQDRAELEARVREVLLAMGEDVHREGLRDTPKRVAKALCFAMRGYGASAPAALGTALFHEENLATASEDLGSEAVERGTHDIVLVRDIPVFSTCAETFMPFYGVIHVGYVPKAGVIVGLSKLARVAEVYARRLQTPDGLARAVAQALQDVASPLGVGVSFSGVQLGPFAPRTMTGKACTGCFATEKSVWWDEFEALVSLGGGTSELSRGVWGNVCGACDDAAPFPVAGGAEASMDAVANEAAKTVSEDVYAGVLRLFHALNLQERVYEATEGTRTVEETARKFSSLLAAMRSGDDAPFSPIEEAVRNAVACENDPTTSEEVCVMSDLHMSTVCEHHLLPFHGTVSVAYCSASASSTPLSRDVLQAIVSRHSRRLQVQERLTRDVAEEVNALTGGVGVMVAARAAHLCMVSRGVEKPGSSTCTVTKLGRFAREPELRANVWARLCTD
jgi:GTP cyclohydrolase I